MSDCRPAGVWLNGHYTLFSSYLLVSYLLFSCLLISYLLVSYLLVFISVGYIFVYFIFVGFIFVGFIFVDSIFASTNMFAGSGDLEGRTWATQSRFLVSGTGSVPSSSRTLSIKQ